MKKLYAKRKLLLRLSPLDAALVDYLSDMTGRKNSHVLREGLRALAVRMPMFEMDAFKRYVDKECLPELTEKAAAKLKEDLGMFADGELFIEPLPGDDDPVFDSRKDFK